MLKEVSKEEWKRVIHQVNSSVFDEPEYLELISSLHTTIIHYYVFYREEKPLLGFAVHVKNHSIIVPDHYSYSSFWWNDSLTDFGFFDTLDAALKDLRRLYKSFSFRLPPEVVDIRAFNTNGCTVKVSFTYLNDTSIKDFRDDIKRKLTKSANQNFSFEISKDYDKILNQHIADFPIFGFTKMRTNFYKNYFNELIKNNYLRSFGLFKENVLIASSLVLIDNSKKRAYNLLISTSKSNYDLEASSLLYKRILASLNQDGYSVLDLYGADMKGIARFKSGFRGNLKPHYTVHYSAKRVYLLDSFGQLKSFLKKFL